MLENKDEPVKDPIPGKMKKSAPAPKKIIRDPEHLWNVPKNRRKEVLRARLDPKEFVAIFGKQFEPEFRDEGYLVTVPQPFEFGVTHPSKYRTAYIKEMLDEKEYNEEVHPFRAKSVPNHVYQPIYRDMVLKEEQKKEDILKRST